MATNRQFGELFHELRIRKGETLREFCSKNGYDPGNISRLERGAVPAPVRPAKLAAFAKALGLRKGDPEWQDFFDAASLSAGRIPPALLSDEQVAARLPLVFRALRNEQPDKDNLEKLIGLIRGS